MMMIIACLCFLLVAASKTGAEGLANSNSSIKPFREMKDLLRRAALGETTATIEALEQLWVDTPSYQQGKQKESLKWWQGLREKAWQELQEKKKQQGAAPVPLHGQDKEFDAIMYNKHGYDPDRDLKRLIGFARSAIARHLLRFHIEEGDVAAAVAVQERQQTQGEEEYLTAAGSVVVQADLYFALGEYEKAVDLYQEHMELTKQDRGRMGQQKPFQDDVLFSKMGLAFCNMGGAVHLQQAQRYFECAAELQDMHGLVVESIVSVLRVHTLCKDPKDHLMSMILPPDFAEFYPTVARILGGAGHAVGSRPEDQDKDNDRALERAFEAYVRGDYVEAGKLFVQASTEGTDNNNTAASERKALRALLMRERNLANLANVWLQEEDSGQQEDDPFFMLKRQVLFFKTVDPWSLFVQRMSNQPYEEDLTAVDAVRTLPHLLHSRCKGRQSTDEYDDHAFTYDEESSNSYFEKVEAVCALLKSSTLRAVAFVQMAKYLKAVADTNKPDIGQTEESLKPTEESVKALLQDDERDLMRQQRQRLESLACIERALEEPEISPLLKIQAKIELVSLECSVAKPKKTQRGRDGTMIHSLQATNEYGVPASSPRSTVPEKNEEDVLVQCWKELEEMGLSTSLTALEVGRRMKKKFGGSRERLVLSALFGNTSKPVLATRKEEAAEDLRSGSGERAEALYTELLSDRNERRRKDPFMIGHLISAKKKQGKYAEAIEVFEEVRKSEDIQTRTDLKGRYLQRLAELHYLNGRLEFRRNGLPGGGDAKE